MTETRRSVSTGAAWEARYGYQRAVALGDRAWVSGTTAASRGDEPADDAASQAAAAFRIAIESLAALGFAASDVVRTRMYLTDVADADAVGEVHSSFFADVRPAATMVSVNGLIDPSLLVEIELEAMRVPNP
jgi:enamine deaminase RidA (YjgF/YER057c/UK114 family)